MERNSVASPESEELALLWRRYKDTNDSEAKERLLLHYVYLVKWIVRRLMPKYNAYSEYDDLLSCGMIGLIDAVDKFDIKHGVKFDTYAVPRVRGEILDYMRAQDWAPPSLRKKIGMITDTYESLERELGAPPPDQRGADALGMQVAQLQKILTQTHMFNIINFEDAVSAAHAVEDVAGGDGESPETQYLDKEMKSILSELIEALPERERMVITLYYYEGMLLKEIAEILQITESRVSQIHSKVLAKMRARLRKVT